MNKFNNKCYIGQTTNLSVRWRSHCSLMSTTPAIRDAIQTYGIHVFDLIILDTAENEIEAKNKEKFFIDYENSLFPNGYNLSCGNENITKYRVINYIKDPQDKLIKIYIDYYTNKINNIPIICDTLQTKYSNIKECSEKLKMKIPHIINVLDKKIRTYRKLKFSYI